VARQNNDIANQAMIQGAERQLGYLVKVCNSLFSYGLPSSTSKLPLRYASQNQQQQCQIKNRYDDFTIISRIIYTIKLINQLK